MPRSFDLPFHDYKSAESFANGKWQEKIGNNTLLERDTYSGNFYIRLHGHIIARLRRKEIVLDHCGWQTVTTAQRLRGIMLAICPNWSLLIKKGVWTLEHVDGRKIPFNREVTLDLRKG